jgi:hypothetical protein
MPRADSPSFGLYLSGAPGSSHGLCLVSRSPSTFGTNYFNTTLWVDPARILLRVPIVTDALGYAEASLPIPPGTTGQSFWAQFIVRNAQVCTNGPLAASNALRLTIQ